MTQALRTWHLIIVLIAILWWNAEQLCISINGSTPFSLFAQDPACKCVRRICGDVKNGKKVAKSCIRLAYQFDLNLLQRLLNFRWGLRSHFLNVHLFTLWPQPSKTTLRARTWFDYLSWIIINKALFQLRCRALEQSDRAALSLCLTMKKSLHFFCIWTFWTSGPLIWTGNSWQGI